jgi:uncharacterized protein YifN (PemK superfamily)
MSVALWFYPEPGMVLMCDFAGYVEPEMVKTRRVVVVSGRSRVTRLEDVVAIVVPLSMTEPLPARTWHHAIQAENTLVSTSAGQKAPWSHMSAPHASTEYALPGSGLRLGSTMATSKPYARRWHMLWAST